MPDFVVQRKRYTVSLDPDDDTVAVVQIDYTLHNGLIEEHDRTSLTWHPADGPITTTVLDTDEVNVLDAANA